LSLPAKDPAAIPIPPGTLITANGYTADGKSQLHRDIDANRYEAIEDFKYIVGLINPLHVEQIEREVIEYEDKLAWLYHKKLV
jgi:hypothetical protein